MDLLIPFSLLPFSLKFFFSSRSPGIPRQLFISSSFPLFVSSSASHPRLHCSSRQPGWSLWPSTWPVACPCSWFPGRREKGAPHLSPMLPSSSNAISKKLRSLGSPNGGLQIHLSNMNIYLFIYFYTIYQSTTIL